jgi:imidazolonepropionase-like amidohydrolase
MVVKTTGNTVSDALLVETCTVAATLGDGAQKRGDGSPGTRGKMMAMLREQFIKAQEYRAKLQAAEEDEEENLEADNTDASDGEADDENDEEQKKDPPPRNLRLEVLVKVLDQELPLMVTAHRAHDIASVLRLAREFEINVWLDGAAEAYLLVDEIKAAGVPVIIHPPMTRYGGELQNASFETAGKLIDAGIPVVFQSGFEQYVPKTRVVLWEAAMAAAHGVAFDDALARITREPAELLGVADRVGSLEVGKDADLALFNGDPFEYTTHCTAVVINGEVVDDDPQ